MRALPLTIINRRFPLCLTVDSSLRLGGPDLPDGVGNADVVVDEVEQPSEGGSRNDQQQTVGDLRDGRSEQNWPHVVGDDGFQTPAERRS